MFYLVALVFLAIVLFQIERYLWRVGRLARRLDATTRRFEVSDDKPT